MACSKVTGVELLVEWLSCKPSKTTVVSNYFFTYNQLVFFLVLFYIKSFNSHVSVKYMFKNQMKNLESKHLGISSDYNEAV